MDKTQIIALSPRKEVKLCSTRVALKSLSRLSGWSRYLLYRNQSTSHTQAQRRDVKFMTQLRLIRLKTKAIKKYSAQKIQLSASNIVSLACIKIK